MLRLGEWRRRRGAVEYGCAFFTAEELRSALARGAVDVRVVHALAARRLDGSAMKEMAGVARGLSDAGFPEELLWRSVWLPLPQAFFFLALAAWVISRRAL